MSGRPIRVALSGSGFRLPAHLGALRAITDAGYDVVEIAGTSGGSIVGALYASGLPLKSLYTLCMETDWTPMMRFSLWAFLRNQALASADPMQDFLAEQTAGQTFADLLVDLKVIASDVATMQQFEFSREKTPNVPIALAARASASIPVVFPPVKIGSDVLFDGGMCNNIPSAALTIDKVPRIGIYLEAKDPPMLNPSPSLLNLLPRVIDLMLASNEAERVATEQGAGGTIVRVETGYASSFDRNMKQALRQRLYDDGYKATATALNLLPPGASS